MKEAAYKGLVRPVLEYGSSVWDPHTHGLQQELEKVQNRAARFVTGNYVFETGSMTGILGQLKWESLKKTRKDSRLILLYKRVKPEYQQMTLSQRICVVEINTLLLFRYLQLAKKRTKVVSFHRLSGTRMTSLIHLSPLLKCLMTVCTNSLHSCVQGTNFSPIRTPW